MVAMPIDAYSKNLETMAILKILAMGNDEIEAGKFEDAHEWLDKITGLVPRMKPASHRPTPDTN